MSRLQNEISLKGLIKKHDLSQPVPENLQDHSAVMKRQYKNILKKTGQYSLISSLLIGFYFLLKKLSIQIPFVKFTVAVVTVSTVSGGAYFAVKKYSRPQTQKPVISAHSQKIITSNMTSQELDLSLTQGAKTTKSHHKLPVNTNAKFAISVKPFVSKSIDKGLVRLITQKIIYNLSKKQRIKNSSFSAVNSFGKVDFGIIGNIEKMDGIMLLTVKIINPRSSAVVYLVDKQIESISEINKVCYAISTDLYNKLKRNMKSK